MQLRTATKTKPAHAYEGALAGWRSIFFVNLPIGMAGLWLTSRYVGETPGTQGRGLDLAGQLLAIAVLGCLAYGIIEAGVHGAGDKGVLAAFALSSAAIVLFIVREARTSQPMLPLSLFSSAMFSRTAAIGLLVNVAFYGLIFVLSLYFQNVEKRSAFETGLAFIPMMGAVLPANLLASRISERFGARGAIAAGAAISAAGCAASSLDCVRHELSRDGASAYGDRGRFKGFSCPLSPPRCSGASRRHSRELRRASSTPRGKPEASSGLPYSAPSLGRPIISWRAHTPFC